MRINIKTKKPIKDRDLKAMYIIQHALSFVSLNMKVATLQYFADKLGQKVVPK